MYCQHIVSVQDDSYIVICGEGNVENSDMGSKYISAGVAQYACIFQEDYWNGIPAYQAAQ